MTHPKTILITGSTDGIGLEAAKRLAADGHEVLLHGRTPAKLEAAASALAEATAARAAGTFLADLSTTAGVEALAAAVAAAHPRLDVLINNAGVYRTPSPRTESGLDVRFAVNTLAPYLLTRRLLPRIPADGRVVNLSSAAQAPVSLEAIAGQAALSEGAAYAQSKLALNMWTRALADELGPDGPVVVAVNPGSMLGSKMVKEAFGVAGHDIGIGADILHRAALSEAFADASGAYFDNDAGRFDDPHPAGLDDEACRRLVAAMHGLLGLAGG